MYRHLSIKEKWQTLHLVDNQNGNTDWVTPNPKRDKSLGV